MQKSIASPCPHLRTAPLNESSENGRYLETRTFAADEMIECVSSAIRIRLSDLFI
jgi:hypothetical protein